MEKLIKIKIYLMNYYIKSISMPGMHTRWTVIEILLCCLCVFIIIVFSQYLCDVLNYRLAYFCCCMKNTLSSHHHYYPSVIALGIIQ